MEMVVESVPPALQGYDVPRVDGGWDWFHTDAPVGSIVPRDGEERYLLTDVVSPRPCGDEPGRLLAELVVRP
jgi:hypothetical protein